MRLHMLSAGLILKATRYLLGLRDEVGLFATLLLHHGLRLGQSVVLRHWW